MAKLNYCNDYGGAPGCLGTIDERYTMRFDDIGEAPIYWCTACGPRSRLLGDLLIKALETRGPEYEAEVSKLINEAYDERTKQ